MDAISSTEFAGDWIEEQRESEAQNRQPAPPASGAAGLDVTPIAPRTFGSADRTRRTSLTTEDLPYEVLVGR